MHAALRTVVAYDGSPDAEAALTWAVQHATENRSPLTLVYVDDGVTVLPDEPLTYGSLQRAAGALELRAARIREAVPGLTVSSVADVGDVFQRLLDESAPDVLLVVGAGSRGVLHISGRWSLAARLIAHTTGPVAIIPPVSVERKGVVVGVDGGAESDRLARFAALLALHEEQPLHIVHAWLPPVMWLNPWPLDAKTQALVEKGHRRFLTDTVDHVRHYFAGIAIDGTLVKANAAVALLGVVPSPGLIVVGRHSRSGLQKALLGSTSLSILLNVATPCIIVPDAVETKKSGAA